MKELEKFEIELAKKIVEKIEDDVRKELENHHRKLGKAAKIYAENNSIVISVPERPWKFVLFGTRPHKICARLYRQCGRPDPLWKRASPVLAFFWKKMGVFVITRYVRHPGYKPRKSIDALRKRLIEIVISAIKQSLGVTSNG